MFQAASQRGGTEATERTSFTYSQPYASAQLGQDPYESYDQMVKALEKAKSEKDELQSLLDRLKDQKDIQKMKSSALGGAASGAEHDQ